MSSKKNSNSGSSHSRGKHQEIKEDVPEYRSVIMRPLAPPMNRSLAPPPPMKLSKPLTRIQISQELKRTTTAIRKVSQWTVSDPVTLPPGHLLERTNVYVEDATAQECADRVCDCLRMLSIAATASTKDDLEADSSFDKNVLRAETQDCVKFAVRLFTDQGKVVVEVQRTSGCSFGFREASRAVLRSAKGLSQSPSSRKQFTISSALPPRSREILQSCVRDDFEIACSMLQSERSDSKLLALESLEQMTQSCTAVDVAAKSVLSCECLQMLVALLDRETEGGSEWSVLTRKVLAVLANACAALSPVDLAEILSCDKHLKESSFLCFLLTSLRDAAKRPHDAYHAVRCLQALLISKEVEDTIVQMSVMDVVESACRAGCNSHRALEQESHKLMGQLRNVCC